MHTLLIMEDLVQHIRCWYLNRLGMFEYVIENKSVDQLECHVLASGWSLNESFHLIDRSTSFVIGFNFSFLKCPNPDIHFIENASYANRIFFLNTMHHYFGLESGRIFEKTRLVFKNLSEFKNSAKLIFWLYGSRAEFVRDRHYRIYSDKGLRPTLESMLKQKILLPQTVSSVMSFIFLSRIMGFRKIIVHGLDFVGPHFYGPDLNQAIYFGQQESRSSKDWILHKTAADESGIGTPEVLRELKYLLGQEGIELFSAVQKSPSSKIIGSYFD